MPTVLCPACNLHSAVLEPYDPTPVPCPKCGKPIAPPPVPTILQLTPDERAQMDGWHRYLNSLRLGPPVAREPYPDRYERLRNAVTSGATWRVKWELVDGADPNLAKPMMPYPLHDAAEAGHVEIVRLLLAVGADPGNLNSDRLTPQEIAARRGHADVVEVLQRSVGPRMRILSVLFPINFLLAGFFVPAPIVWIGIAGGYFGAPSLGMLGIGYFLLWLFTGSKRFEERSRMVGYVLLLGGGLSTVLVGGLSLLVGGMNLLRQHPVLDSGLGPILIFIAASAAVTGLGYWQLKLTPGDGSYDERT